MYGSTVRGRGVADEEAGVTSRSERGWRPPARGRGATRPGSARGHRWCGVQGWWRMGMMSHGASGVGDGAGWRTAGRRRWRGSGGGVQEILIVGGEKKRGGRPGYIGRGL
jgi:hypothetical protein